jgi:hypothetical protein
MNIPTNNAVKLNTVIMSARHISHKEDSRVIADLWIDSDCNFLVNVNLEIEGVWVAFNRTMDNRLELWSSIHLPRP